jgi:amidase
MGKFKEYRKFDALGLAELIKKKKISAPELIEEAISRIEDLNPLLNAVVTPMYDIAREYAGSKIPKGPFTGVPFLIKDIMTAYKGIPLTSGSRSLKEYIPDYHSEMTERFIKSGLNIAGKTNTPEFGLTAYTEPELFGAARNPWNTGHTPGGSSGGSAAAVASGMVPMASGNDGGGSIRIPASCCGLFGLKPSRGRNPLGPAAGEVWQGAAVEGVISRSVRDSAAALDATQGGDRGAPFIIPEPEISYMNELKKKPGSLKIAFTPDSPLGTEVHKECISAVYEAAGLLEELGHKVENDKPSYDGRGLAASYMTLYMGEVAANIHETSLLTGKKGGSSDFELATWILGMLGRSYTAGDFVRAMRTWHRTSRAMGVFFDKYDIFCTPVTAYPPVKIGELKPKPFEIAGMKLISGLRLGKLLKVSGIVDKLAEANLAKTPFTQLANLTGLPAMSVPLYWTEEGLPVGIQFIAKFGCENILFRLAAQLEKARPWFDRVPKVKK